MLINLYYNFFLVRKKRFIEVFKFIRIIIYSIKYKKNICIKYNSMNSKDELNEKMKVFLSNQDFGKYIQNLDKKGC